MIQFYTRNKLNTISYNSSFFSSQKITTYLRTYEKPKLVHTTIYEKSCLG